MIITNFRELSIVYRQMFASIREQDSLMDDTQDEILAILGLVWTRTRLGCGHEGLKYLNNLFAAL